MIFKGGHKSFITYCNPRIISIYSIRAHQSTRNKHGFYYPIDLFLAANGVYGYYTGIAIRDERLVATFEYHSRIAKYISLLLPIAVCLFFWYKDKLSRLSLSLFVILCSFSLILTMNRTSWWGILLFNKKTTPTVSL